MRLLHARTLQVKNFDNDHTTPTYAILSHTWGADEVTYQDISSAPEAAVRKQGYAKINYCATQAKHDGIEYIWVDTCCIDKSSSAELSEAINSMFRWYRNAKVCYAYMVDVPAPPSQISMIHSWVSLFTHSRWFTRGWTLQELIAPSHLVFYSQDWQNIGTKGQFAYQISVATGIPKSVLLTGRFSDTRVAERMNWAATRSTTRIEDMAYCLMGIFDVNMPMLYGEGEKAFARLQEEIMKSSQDTSLFIWRDPTSSFSSYRGVLAKSPSNFQIFNSIGSICMERSIRTKPFNMTNKGLMIDLPIVPRPGYEHEFCALLSDPSSHAPMICIYLKKVSHDSFVRVDPHKVCFLLPHQSQSVVPVYPGLPPNMEEHRVFDTASTDGLVLDSFPSSHFSLTTLFLQQNVRPPEIFDINRVYGICLENIPDTCALIDAQPFDKWDKTSRILKFDEELTKTIPSTELAFSFRREEDLDWILELVIKIRDIEHEFLGDPDKEQRLDAGNRWTNIGKFTRRLDSIPNGLVEKHRTGKPRDVTIPKRYAAHMRIDFIGDEQMLFLRVVEREVRTGWTPSRFHEISQRRREREAFLREQQHEQ